MAIAGIWEQARAAPDKVAAVHNGNPFCYANFARSIDGTRRFLAAQGVPSGTVAVIGVQNLLEAWILLFALRTLGLTTVAVGSVAQLSTVPLRNVGVVVTSATRTSGFRNSPCTTSRVSGCGPAAVTAGRS